jgi:hypothetical protein
VRFVALDVLNALSETLSTSNLEQDHFGDDAAPAQDVHEDAHRSSQQQEEDNYLTNAGYASI